MFHKEIPPKILQDLILYSLPLLLISSERNLHENEKYWGAIIGSFVGTLPVFPNTNGKSKLVLSAVFYLLSVLIPSFYYISFGFILNQSYTTNIFRSNKKSVSRLISKIELIGYLISETIRIPIIIKICLGLITLILALLGPCSCSETDDPFDCMKTKIDSATILNAEYRSLLKNEPIPFKFNVYLIDILYFFSDRKLSLLFGMVFSFNLSESILFIISILYVFDIPWEILCVLYKSEPYCNVNVRIVINYLIFLIMNYVEKNSLLKR